MSEKTDPNRFYTAMGRFVAAFAAAELTIGATLISSLSLKGEGATIMVQGMSVKVKTRKLKFTISKVRRDLLPLNDALNTFDEINDFRDRLLHWYPFVSQDAASAQLADTFRNTTGLFGPIVQVTPEQMDAISDWLQLFGMHITFDVLVGQPSTEELADVALLLRQEAPPVPKAEGTTLRKPL